MQKPAKAASMAYTSYILRSPSWTVIGQGGGVAEVCAGTPPPPFSGAVKIAVIQCLLSFGPRFLGEEF